MSTSTLLENPWFIPALIGAVLFFQLILLMMIGSLSRKVRRLIRMQVPQEPPIGPELADRKEANADQKQWFNVFLDEDPARRELPKKEQFAAFRRWREERGMNWKS